MGVEVESFRIDRKFQVNFKIKEVLMRELVISDSR